YSLSDRLIRNRRSVVGGFARRRFHRHSVEVPAAEQRVRQAALDRLRSSSLLRGAPLAELLRRLESSPAAFQSALRGSKNLAALAKELALPARDAKFHAFHQLLARLWESEPQTKVLVFTEARDTLEMLIEQLRSERIEALAYHGDLPLVQRDRQVARFRDPDGPAVLISTEIGGEGRNFQFAHHLINYDLPWSPAVMEQRIGRLDRIGQLRTVEIHAFDPVGTLSSDVLSLLADGVGVFEETVGGLDALLEEVEPRLTELALQAPADRAEYARSLRPRVAAQRESLRRAYDPLLDLRSFDRAAVDALLARGWERLGLEGEEIGSLEEGLWTLARDLEERLEETVTQLARKVGIGVDTDQHVETFQCAFHLGRELTVEALPGISLAEDRVVLGTFWRDTAIEQEEIEYFATGHPIVEALFAFLRDGPFGRNAVRYLERRGAPKSRGLEFLFQIHPPEPDDTAPGARVPSRQLSRFVKSWLSHVAVRQDAAGKPKLDPGLLEVLRQEGQSLKGAEVQAAFPGLSAFVDPAMAAATAAAQWQLASLSRSARALIESEREQRLKQLRLSLEHQSLPAAAIGEQLQRAGEYYDRLLRALAGLRLALDSVSGFVINR
ncbi:MAG TPA: helicase-related protein, partial [Myxococcaceae bacterium]|nr:helicase-related protein [Myxococcaceae bacterium]